MATTRIATQPRVKNSKKSANFPHEVQPELQANDPLLAQARAVADTIRQLERGRIPRDLPKLPLFSDDAPSPAPPPAPKPKPRLRHSSTDAPSPDLARHRRKCVVCNHPDREEIEEQFVQWHHPGDIAHDFQIEEARYIRRHAHAVGLYARRRENYLFTLENILERGDEIELTASAYMKAVRAYACLCDTVRWTEPAIRVIGIRDHSAVAVPAPATEDNVHCQGTALAVPSSSTASWASATEVSSPASLPTNTLAQTERIVGQTTTTLPEAASPDGTSCGSERNSSRAQPREPRHEADANGDSFGERLEGRGDASTPLRASSRFSEPAPKDSNEAARAKNHGADDGGDGTSRISNVQPPTSNRPSPRLETGVSDGKQRKEVLSNRP